MKIAKFIKLSLLAVIITASFTACKKDKTTAPPVSLEGKWTGKYGLGDNPPSTDFHFNIIVAASKLEATLDGVATTYTGNWLLVAGGAFTATYSINGITYNYSAKFDDSASGGGKLINGTWGKGISYDDGGKWSMTKDQ
ncbi:MAG: hypothetical protein WBP45_09225 [Daejeonella sp.]